MTGGALRHALRLPAFTTATVGLGLGAHASQGDVLPRPGVLVVAVLAVAVLGAAFTHRERGLGALLVAVGAVQAGLHVALGGPVTHQAHPWSMTAAHVVAAALTAWLLRCGEVRAWAAVRRVVRAVAVPDVAVPATVRRAVLLTDVAPARPVTTWQRRPAALRGPPSRTCPAAA